MRASLVCGSLGCLFLVAAAPFACIPHPEEDFENYQGRISGFPTATVDASGIDAGPPPTQAVEGTYYAACLPELAFGQVNDALSFITKTKFVPDPGGNGGRLTLSIQPLAIVNDAPPPTVSQAGAVGNVIPSPEPATPNVTQAGRYRIELGTVSVPGSANPISGGNIVIESAFMEGPFAEAQFCARLGGNVTQPAAAARTLTPEKNICQFRPIKDGDPRPPLTSADFQAASCPL